MHIWQTSFGEKVGARLASERSFSLGVCIVALLIFNAARTAHSATQDQAAARTVSWHSASHTAKRTPLPKQQCAGTVQTLFLKLSRNTSSSNELAPLRLSWFSPSKASKHDLAPAASYWRRSFNQRGTYLHHCVLLI